METGRRDGMISDASKAGNMPDVEDSIQLLKAKFQEKGLTSKDLVLLSGMYVKNTNFLSPHSKNCCIQILCVLALVGR